MNENNWKSVWEKRIADMSILRGNNEREIVLELKRCNGFDVLGDGLCYEAIRQQYQEIKENLSMSQGMSSKPINSIYEVGAGSGANLFLFEKDGIQVGGMDYSKTLAEIARRVLHTDDFVCDEAINLNISPEYDALLSNSVFSYFTDKNYAMMVLEKMYLKAERSIGIIDIHDEEKKNEFLEYRRKSIIDYDEKYKNLPKLFYSKGFFADFAKKHSMEIKFVNSNMDGYWNNEFVFHCYLYK